MDQNRIVYNKSKAWYRKHIKTAKRNSWIHFCQSQKDPFGTPFKFIRDKQLHYDDLIHITIEGMPTDSNRLDIQEFLIHHHFPTPLNVLSSSNLTFPTIDLVQNDTYAPIQAAEIASAIRETDLNKAPGYDKIDSQILKRLINIHQPFFIKLFNFLLQNSYFPTQWKSANAIFFHKKKQGSTSPLSYRPICLLPTVSKVFEKILIYRLNYFLSSNKILHPNQYGFREGHNTLQSIKRLTSEIESRNKSFKYSSTIFFDIVGAFDNADWSIILSNLNK